MAAHICGPFRCATGLLKTKESSGKEIKEIDGSIHRRLLTWDSVEGEVVSYDPECLKEGSSKSVYKKKTYYPSDFKEMNIRIIAGDVATFYGVTYDGGEVESSISGKFEIRFTEYKWLKDAEEGKISDIEIIDLDKEQKENNEKNTEAKNDME